MYGTKPALDEYLQVSHSLCIWTKFEQRWCDLIHLLVCCLQSVRQPVYSQSVKQHSRCEEGKGLLRVKVQEAGIDIGAMHSLPMTNCDCTYADHEIVLVMLTIVE